MNLYNNLLNEKRQKQEIQRLKQNKRSLEYYYKNKDSVLQQQAQKRLLNPNYYKEWYEKNKIEITEKRRINSAALKKVNKTYNKYSNTNYTPYNNKKDIKELSFTLFF